MWPEGLAGFGGERLGSEHNIAEGWRECWSQKMGQRARKLCLLWDMVLAHGNSWNYTRPSQGKVG